MDEILDNLRFFTKSFSSADSFNIHIEVKKKSKTHEYVFNSLPEELTQTVCQKLGQYMDNKEYKVLSIAVRPIYKPYLLKSF